ncbi:MAG TPA: (2Fe-2S) ferredoxin domain-containing protein [bacterium]|nr:(2Fe-2S) ferredoxin domain-containing protein [bacterium]HPR87206.1 (2Fe-2S) ferredoxin domain-containing protein [bacterium]
MKSLSDLRAIKDKAKKEMAAREQSAKFRIVIAMGTCGIAAGARSVMSAILDEINKRNVTQAVVTQTGCLGFCDQEPLVQVVQSDTGITTTYGKISAEIARKIVVDHVMGGQVVSSHVFSHE